MGFAFDMVGAGARTGTRHPTSVPSSGVSRCGESSQSAVPTACNKNEFCEHAFHCFKFGSLSERS